ncbi:MAG: class I SAM-dependent methyltransferase [Bryobacteraceae bacterium]
MPSVAYILADQERMSRARNYFHWQRDLVLRELGRRVIEVGCGLGNFTRFLLDRELVVAVDFERECVDRVRARFPRQPGLETFAWDAADTGFRSLESFSPDSCVCLNVLEHIEDDRAALANMAAVLPAGGKAVIMVPAHQALYGPIDRHLRHFRRYTKRLLLERALEAGFAVEKLHYMNLAGFFAWWANARVFQREEQSAAQIALFDDWIVPPMRRLESIIAPPFGQSLFAVLRKRPVQ